MKVQPSFRIAGLSFNGWPAGPTVLAVIVILCCCCGPLTRCGS